MPTPFKAPAASHHTFDELVDVFVFAVLNC